jgi:hypothetical protein
MKCGSEKLMPFVGVLDQGQYSDGQLKACIGYTNPDAWIFKGPIFATLQATICGECGFTELSVGNPAELYEKFLAYQEKIGDPAD